jgi:hypothetical protein
MGNAVQLMAMMNTVLRVTVETAPQDSKPTPKGDFKMKS